MAGNLSSFFLKVQVVEEFFLQLNESDKERAITILLSSIKKLQTLLGCTTEVVKSKFLTSHNKDMLYYNDDDDDFEQIDENILADPTSPGPICISKTKRKSAKKKIKLHKKTRHKLDKPVERSKEKYKRVTRSSRKTETEITKADEIVSKSPKVDKNASSHRCKKSVVLVKKPETLEETGGLKNSLKSKRRLFHCSECNVTLTHPRSIQNHIESHGSQASCCRNCHEAFENIQAFEYHVCKLIKSTNNKKKYVCSECGISFKLLKLLKYHLNVFHKTKLKVKKCSMCDLEFTKKSALFRHLKLHAGDKMVCMKCGEFCINFSSFTEHMSRHDSEAKFKCSICEQTFMKVQQFKQHMSGHERYNCSQCVQSFSCNEKLKKHERNTHDLISSSVCEDRSHICDVCGKLFSKPTLLVIHQRLHTGEKPLECSLCYVNFRTKRALLKHKETYSHCIKAGIKKERHFLCSHCGKSFFRKQTLKRHLRCHTGERPHMCQYCGYKTSELNNLKRHALHHFKGQRNFICEICGDAFHTKKTLESHHNHKHNEERNFACTECEMTFKSRSGLNRHGKTHSKIKEHKCWCDVAFGRLSNLRRHMRSVHGSDSALPPVRKIALLDQVDPSEEMNTVEAEKLESEKYDQSQLVLQEQTMMANCLQMTESYQAHQHHQSMSGHMTLDAQGMVYDNMASAQSLVGYPNTQHVGVEHQRPPDYYHSNMNMMDNMAATQDYNNSCMYIQNVLLPSVAGLLDLSHAGK